MEGIGLDGRTRWRVPYRQSSTTECTAICGSSGLFQSSPVRFHSLSSGAERRLQHSRSCDMVLCNPILRLSTSLHPKGK